MLRQFLVLMALLALASPAPVLSQVPTPTPEQLELLRSMGPEDREALLEQLGMGGAAVDTGSNSGASTEQPADGQGDESGERDQFGSARVSNLTLKPDDSVLIDIDFKKDKPARVQSQGANLPPSTFPAELAPILEPEERAQLQQQMDMIRARNPYQLDSTGAVLLPGFAPIVLAGLNDAQATHRLSALLPLMKLDVRLSKLPVRKVGAAGLKPFGYDLFKGSTSTFAPVNDVPIPADYIVGPGDRLTVQLFGNQNRTLRLVVGELSAASRCAGRAHRHAPGPSLPTSAD